MMRSSTTDRRNRVRDGIRRGALAVMAIGALLLGFVAYQLWGTGIQHANAQRELRTEFERALTTVPRPSPSEPLRTSIPPTATTLPATVAPPRSPWRPARLPTAAPPVSPSSTVPASTLPPPTTPTPPTAPPDTVPPDTVPPDTAPSDTVPRPVYALGDPVLRLEIPKIGVDEIVVSGVGVGQLKMGPGHYPDTPLPGEPGNAAIAGHRTTYGAPFFSLDELEPGDEIVATTYNGRFVFRVIDMTVVAPSEVGVLAPTDDSRLTLTTCNPKYSARERLVVSAVLEPPVVPEPPPPPSTSVATTTPPPSTEVPLSTPPAATATSSSATTTSAPAVSSTTTTAVRPAPAAGRRDSGSRPGPSAGTVAGELPTTSPPDTSGLGAGWFSDGGAWLPVLLWGSTCAIVVVLAGLLGRRSGFRPLGWIAGAVPFTVGLYFFYENVNRLLPAGV
jgi:sortase A